MNLELCGYLTDILEKEKRKFPQIINLKKQIVWNWF